MSLDSGSSLGTFSNRQWPQSSWIICADSHFQWPGRGTGHSHAYPYEKQLEKHQESAELRSPNILTPVTPVGVSKAPQDKAWGTKLARVVERGGGLGLQPNLVSEFPVSPGGRAASKSVLPGFCPSIAMGPLLLPNLCPSLSCPSLAVSKPQGLNSFQESQEHSCESLSLWGRSSSPSWLQM